MAMTWTSAQLRRLSLWRVFNVPRKELPTLKEMARVVDSTFETVCRELNTLLPERRQPRTVAPSVWVVEPPFAMAA